MSLKNFPKDIVMPKKPKTAFMCFSKKHYVKGKTAAQMSKEISEKWNKLSEK